MFRFSIYLRPAIFEDVPPEFVMSTNHLGTARAWYAMGFKVMDHMNHREITSATYLME